MFELTIAFLIFLCWGSFLNVVGYRLVEGTTLLGRSACPYCKKHIAWYDLIPILSWLILKMRCRSCHKTISYLYPTIELLTALIMTAMLIYIQPTYWLAYFLFFSALIVTIRTDAEYMLISTYMTLYLMPIGILLSIFKFLPLNPVNSILGTIAGYAVLWFIAHVFKRTRKKEGLGQGDIDLLAMIGAFTGLLGVWITLFLGALFGSIIGLTIALCKKKHDIAIPFGPWLALGAIIYVFFQEYLIAFIVN